MDHCLWMYNMHYETGAGLKPEFIDAKLKAALAVLERRRVAEQESMSETVQQIKEQVMNLARRPTTSAPDDTGDESDEDDYVDLTP
ncbi:hypothetical protein H5410_036528 [Solanum commersonii]|uniref:Uncharacterized protein n=1 Tax=Solanum commersonii TaxID=4109 RepID=A0A9J5Y6T4_SOLCO|nr:hypothetical protein H5410_036528 [Solanum commersonii]